MTTQQKEIARRLIVEAVFQRRLAAKIGLNVFGSIMAMRYVAYVGAAKLVCNPTRTVNDNNMFDRFTETMKLKQEGNLIMPIVLADKIVKSHAHLPILFSHYARGA